MWYTRCNPSQSKFDPFPPIGIPFPIALHTDTRPAGRLVNPASKRILCIQMFPSMEPGHTRRVGEMAFTFVFLYQDMTYDSASMISGAQFRLKT